MPSIYEGNLSKTMVKQSLAKTRAEKLKRDKAKYPLPTVIKQGMNNTIKQSNANARAENNQRMQITNLIMDEYKMPYKDAKEAYNTLVVPYRKQQEKTAERAAFIGDKYNLNTLFTSKPNDAGYQSASALTNMLTPTEGKLEENPYFKQGVSMEGFLSTTNAGRAVSDPNANNRYRYAGDAAAGRADTPYNAPTFQQQFKDIKAAFEEDPRLMAEVVGMSLAQDFVKTALPIAASAVPGGAALANTEMGKNLNRGIMQFALDNAPVSDAAKYTVKSDWLADPTSTSYIDPALLALSVGTGGVSGAFPITSKLVKAGKAVATSEKAAKAAGNVRDAGGVLAGTVLSSGGMGPLFNVGKAQRAADAAKAKYADEIPTLTKEELDTLKVQFEDALTVGNIDEAERVSALIQSAGSKTGKTEPKTLSQKIDDAVKIKVNDPSVQAKIRVTEEELRIIALRNPSALEEAKKARKGELTEVWVEPRENAPLLQQLRRQKGRLQYQSFKEDLINRKIYTEEEIKELEKAQVEAYKNEYGNIFGLEDTDRATHYYYYTKNDEGKKIPLDEEPDHINAQARLANFGKQLLRDENVSDYVVKNIFEYINDPINFSGLNKKTNQSMQDLGYSAYKAQGKDVENIFEEGSHYVSRAEVSDAKLRSILGPKYYKEYLSFDNKNYKDPEDLLSILYNIGRFD